MANEKTGFQQYGYTPNVGGGSGTYSDPFQLQGATVTATGGTAKSSSSALDSILGNSGEALGGVAAIIAAIKGTNYVGGGAGQYINGSYVAPAATNNMMWYIIGALVLLVVLWFLMAKKK